MGPVFPFRRSWSLPVLVFLYMPFMGGAQNIPLVSGNTWMLRAGDGLSLPLSASYHDFSLVKGSDYYWEYNADPQASFSAPFLEADRIVQASFKNDNIGFYSYGPLYRQSVTKLDYAGWEGGGNSGVFYEGKGTKTWRDHYLQAHFKITHQFGLGRNYRPVLNTLGFSMGFPIYETTKRDFRGSFNNGDEYEHVYLEKGRPARWYVPQLRLNYEFSMALKTKKFLVMPCLETSLLCFNNFLRFGFPDHEPLQRRTEFYKEISVGVALVRNTFK